MLRAITHTALHYAHIRARTKDHGILMQQVFHLAQVIDIQNADDQITTNTTVVMEEGSCGTGFFSTTKAVHSGGG